MKFSLSLKGGKIPDRDNQGISRHRRTRIRIMGDPSPVKEKKERRSPDEGGANSVRG